MCTKAFGPHEVLTFLWPFTPLQTIPHRGSRWGSVSSAGCGGLLETRHREPQVLGNKRIRAPCQKSSIRICIKEFAHGWTFGMSSRVNMQPRTRTALSLLKHSEVQTGREGLGGHSLLGDDRRPRKRGPDPAEPRTQVTSPPLEAGTAFLRSMLADAVERITSRPGSQDPRQIRKEPPYLQGLPANVTQGRGRGGTRERRVAEPGCLTACRRLTPLVCLKALRLLDISHPDLPCFSHPANQVPAAGPPPAHSYQIPGQGLAPVGHKERTPRMAGSPAPPICHTVNAGETPSTTLTRRASPNGETGHASWELSPRVRVSRRIKWLAHREPGCPSVGSWCVWPAPADGSRATARSPVPCHLH